MKEYRIVIYISLYIAIILFVKLFLILNSFSRISAQSDIRQIKPDIRYIVYLIFHSLSHII